MKHEHLGLKERGDVEDGQMKPLLSNRGKGRATPRGELLTPRAEWLFLASMIGLILASAAWSVILMKGIVEHWAMSSLGTPVIFGKAGFLTLLQAVSWGVGGALLVWWHGHSLSTTAELRHQVYITTLLELSATGLSCAAVLFLYPSVWTLLRSSTVVYSFILSIFFLNKSPSSTEYTGAGIILCAMVLCSFASSRMDDGPKIAATSLLTQSFMGISLLQGSCFLRSLQYAVEEVAMKELEIPPGVLLLGQGLCGTPAIILVLLFLNIIPGSDTGDVHENTLDTFFILSHDFVLLALVCALFLCWVVQNLFLKLCTNALSGFSTAVINIGMRPVCVWCLALFFFYGLRLHHFGEPWIHPYSSLNLLGFGILVMGAIVYQRKTV